MPPPVVIMKNSALAPVTFTKERIIVTICNARLNTEPSTSISTAVIPESLDLRGVTAQNTAAVPQTGAVSLAEKSKEANAAPAPKTPDDYADGGGLS